MSGAATMLRAFGYLQATSLVNAIRQRLRRLRQPKYLLGALAAGAYLYFFILRGAMRAGGPGHGGLGGVPVHALPMITAGAALILGVIVLLAWLVPGDRAALRFSEAEVAFLFPAPLSRVSLIQFSLLRSQLGIFFSAFLMSLLLRRGGSSGGSAWQHATAIWLLLATLKLHFIGASFARERLLDFGVRPRLRRLLISAIVLAVGLASAWWLRANVRLPATPAFADPDALFGYVAAVLGAPPVSWLLAPFKLLVDPLFAIGMPAWLGSLWPALLLLVAHYLWVLRSHVSFEEASMDRARKRAERVSAMRDGKNAFQRAPTKPRLAPFRLAAHGFAPVAFLWKGLIGAGPFWRLRSWLIGCAVVLIGSHWLAADSARKPALQVIGVIAGMICAWLFLLGPMLVQRGMRQGIEHLDILKAGPLHGWQIALGELLTPTVIISFVQWLLLLVVLMSLDAKPGPALMSSANIGAGALGTAVLVPLLCALMLCVPFAGMLVFPAWAMTSGNRGGGFEVMGQRMIFMGGYIVALAIALLPAAVVGGLGFLLLRWLGNLPSALLVAALLAALVIAVELFAAVWWLGQRIEGFDVSQELR